MKKSKPDIETVNINQQMARDLSAFMEGVKPEVEQFTEFIPIVLPDRSKTSPPTEPIKDKFNPDGIQDIITFCEHPYFLNLRLTPWQKLILKIFYKGAAGNTHLTIESNRTKTCKNCVWEINNKASEESICEYISKNPDTFILPTSYMHTESSPCLQCKRFNQEHRQVKYDFLKELALTNAMQEIISTLEKRPVEDQYRTEEDIFKQDLDERVRQQVERKIGFPFQELILVLGRRGSKSFLVSVIASYEVYTLLMMKHPQARFPLLEFDPINILNVANSEGQAKEAIFDKIKALVDTSPYFVQHTGRSPTQLSIWFLTEHDKEENKRREGIGIAPLDGTIRCMCGHSNSATQLGGTIIDIIIDEMAIMAKANSADGGIDSDLYSLLKPSIATFGLAGKMICISNPLGPFGKFYELYESSFVDDSTLMLQLPTWLSNPTIDPRFLRAQQSKDPQNFDMHYGAQFGSTGNHPFLPAMSIYTAFDLGANRTRVEQGYAHVQYFAHLDPAYSSDNYTLVVVHCEDVPGGMLDTEGKLKKRIVVDHMHLWRPLTGFPVDSNEVDSYIIQLSNKFKFAQISYDHWGSLGSITKLKQYGLNVVQVTFSTNYQNLIFSELYELFTNGYIDIYSIDSMVLKDNNLINLEEATECKKQLLTLQKKWRANNTFKIEALTGSHDDFPDCLAASSYEALKFKAYQKMPKTRSVYIGPNFR